MHSATLHSLQAFTQLHESTDCSNVFACSAKQANRLLKQKNCVAMFAMQKSNAASPDEIGSAALNAQMSMSRKERDDARRFVTAQLKNCDELVQNTVYANQKWTAEPKLDNIRNVLYVDSS